MSLFHTTVTCDKTQRFFPVFSLRSHSFMYTHLLQELPLFRREKLLTMTSHNLLTLLRKDCLLSFFFWASQTKCYLPLFFWGEMKSAEYLNCYDAFHRMSPYILFFFLTVHFPFSALYPRDDLLAGTLWSVLPCHFCCHACKLWDIHF